MNKKKFTALALVWTLLLSCISGVSPVKAPAAQAASSQLAVSFIDVGQGNATLIQYKGKNFLIDTGTEKTYSKLKSFLKKKKIKKIHTLIVTHNDADHMGAADWVIRDYKTRNMIESKLQNKKSTYEIKELKSAVKKYKVKVKKVKQGGKINFGKSIKATVLAPSTASSDSNANSLVIKLVYKKTSFLLTGDTDAKTQNAFMQKYNVKADVFQVSHHGSGYSNGILFIKTVSPKYAVISVGANNSYGHPTKQVLSRLAAYAGTTYRTDKNGSITFTSNGKNITVKTTGSSDTSNNTTVDTSDNSSASTDKPVATNTPATQTGSIIGNKNTKVYHSSTCGNLPYPQNRVYFNSSSDAEAAGYRPHSTCTK